MTEKTQIFKRGNYIWSVTLLEHMVPFPAYAPSRTVSKILMAYGIIGSKLRTSIVRTSYRTPHSKSFFGRIETKEKNGYQKVSMEDASKLWPELTDRIDKQAFKYTLMS